MAVLLRDALGSVLRDRRNMKNRTLRTVAYMAPCSLGYASEVERGEKEISSELLNAMLRVHCMTLPDFLREVANKIEEMEEGNESRNRNNAELLAVR